MSNSSKSYGRRATSHTIQLTARQNGLSMAEALVLSVVLFWCQGQDGGVHRAGYRWTYRSAKDIAAETGQSPRAVERALHTLREKGVIETQAWRRPDRPGERACHFRPLERGDKLIAAAQAAERNRKSKRRSLDEADYMAVSNTTDRRDRNRQSDGLRKQPALQRDTHPDEEEISSSLRNDDELAGEAHVCQQVEERKGYSSPGVKKERAAAQALAETYNAVLRGFDLPPVTCVTDREIASFLQFERVTHTAGTSTNQLFEQLVRFWPILKPMMPPAVQAYGGNEMRPNVLALGFSASRLAQLVPALAPLDAFGAANKTARKSAFDSKALQVVAAHGLLAAAKVFLMERGELYDTEGWLRLATLTRRALERIDPTWLYDQDERSMNIVSRALGDAEFLPWATHNASRFLPTYRAQKNATARSMRTRNRARDAKHFTPALAPEAIETAKAAYEQASCLPSEQEVHGACISLWRQFAELVDQTDLSEMTSECDQPFEACKANAVAGPLVEEGGDAEAGGWSHRKWG